jgi:disulfide bond formation protein DsbB
MLARSDATGAAWPVRTAALVVAAGVAAAILGAWFFQYVVGLAPCPLCLEQRIPYYFAIPLAALVALGTSYGSSRRVLLFALFALAALMLWNAGLGGYHAGVEWKLWAGPRDCSGTLDSLGTTGGLLKSLENSHVVRCDEAAWRFLGLSLAGYNVLVSLGLAAVALWGAITAMRSAPDR